METELPRWLRERLGPGAAVAASAIDQCRPMFSEEEALVAGAVASRRAEFSTGRWCARRCLRALGADPGPILTGARREPIWPDGFLGSITHAAGVCVAVVVRAGEMAGVGIDIIDVAEARSVLAGSADLISTAAERELVHWEPAILFSAKESAIKAISAQVGRFVDFTEIRVSFAAGRFEAACGAFAGSIQGWCTMTGKRAFTAAVASRPRR